MTAKATDQMKCWVCGDRPEDGQEGYSSTLMVLPPLTKPVPVCGMCLLRAEHKTKEE
jgi:hypothetical protein